MNDQIVYQRLIELVEIMQELPSGKYYEYLDKIDEEFLIIIINWFKELEILRKDNNTLRIIVDDLKEKNDGLYTKLFESISITNKAIEIIDKSLEV